MSRALVLVGLAFVVISLALPVLVERDKQLSGYDAFWMSYRYGTSGSLGLFVEAILEEGRKPEERDTIRLFLRWASWAWLANLAAPLGLIGLCVRAPSSLRVLALLSALCACLAAAGFVIPWLKSSQVSEFQSGYWLWVIALGGISIGLLGRSVAAATTDVATTSRPLDSKR